MVQRKNETTCAADRHCFSFLRAHASLSILTFISYYTKSRRNQQIHKLHIFVYVYVCMYICIKRERERSNPEVHTGNLSSELTAASSLLRLTCDAVVELDSELRLTAHSPELSAMLLHDRAGASLDGKCITEFMQPIDAVRAIELLGTSSNESGLAKAEITAHAFHTRLVDSCSSRLCAEVFQVKYTKCDGRCYHLLGFRDFTDIKSLAGINAVDAFTEGEDSR